jgi:diguanylate cyclase (GGDEF)-like protein
LIFALSIRTAVLVFLVTTSSILFPELAKAEPQVDSTATELVNAQWLYHWGDLPRNVEVDKWNFDEADWKITPSPSEIPGRQDEKIVWLKVTLPAGSWRDPYLYINSVDLTLQIFQKSGQIYQFGYIDIEGNSQFEGWPWHIIRLPADYAQHEMYFRIFSDYPYIGISGGIAIGERFDLLNAVQGQGLAGLIFVVIVLLVGVISTIMGTIKKDRIAAIATGLLSFNLALMMFAENTLSQVVLYEPLLWRYIAAFSYFLIPAFLAIIIRAWVKSEKSLIISGVLFTSLGFTTTVALLSIFTSFNFVNAYPWFDALFIALVLSLMIGCFNLFKQQGFSGLLMAFGIFTLFASLVIDMMSAHGMITWIGRTGQFGLVLFSLASLAIYLVQDWKQQAALDQLTENLEFEVEERTAELRASQRQLERMAHEDFLTSLLNRRSFADRAFVEISNAIRYERPVSLLLFDIDHFKIVNDSYGHNVGDLVLKAIADSIRETCREGDLICRYGGEEFVVLLHATESGQAQVLAKRLRKSINEIKVISENQTISITASFGLACLDELKQNDDSVEELLEQLLVAADQAMYLVKTSGRDALKIHILSEQVLST